MGFRSSLTKSLNNYAHEKNLLKDLKSNLEGEDVREGLTGCGVYKGEGASI